MATEGQERGRRRLLEAEARLWLFLSHYGLRLFGFKMLVRTLASGQRRAPDAALIASIAQAVTVTAGRHGYSCLRRALAAAWMLRLRGHHATLHYGVRRGEAEVEAHAWLELQGLPVVGHDEARSFVLLDSFPERTARTARY